MARRKASRVELSSVERDTLERLVRRRKVSRGEALRADIILWAADGLNNCEIADVVGVTRQTVRTWRERFVKDRLDGLDDEPRCGAPRKIGDDRIEEIVVKTLETKPKNATHWSTRGMAKASGVGGQPARRRLVRCRSMVRTSTLPGVLPSRSIAMTGVPVRTW